MNEKDAHSDRTSRGCSLGSTLGRREFLAVLAGGALVSLHAACSQGSAPASSGVIIDGPLHYASLTDVAKLIEARELSPVELTEMMLDRIEMVDGRLRSYATVMAEHALAAARTAEQEVQSGSYRGPLHGIPVAVKDLCYTRGVQTMGGSGVFADFVPEYDATAVSRLEEAGAVLLGKLNLTEGAWLGYHPDFEIPVNPWDAELWAGASSSGSGVATAAGLCFASLGSDTGGSIRSPSTANGVVGLKPTYGRVSRYGVIAMAESLDHVGPMTRSTADAAVVLQAIAGFDPNDPTSLQAPVPHMLEELARGVEGVRIGFDQRYATVGVDSNLVASIEAALVVLEGLGAQIIEVELPEFTEELSSVTRTIIRFEAAAAHRATYPSRADDYGPAFREFLQTAAAVTAEAYEDAGRRRGEFSDRFRRVLSSVDAVASPSAQTPFALSREVQYGSGTEIRQAVRAAQASRTPATSFTFPANLAGTPTISLPCGAADSGVPYTIQFLGERLTEPMLCRIGHAYEQATEWHTWHPPV